MAKFSHPYYIPRTGAAFETTERFLHESIVVDTSAERLECVGVPMTRIKGNTYATSKIESHAFIIGESGCGKTRRVILPTIRLLAKTNESMVVSDPKGELYRKTANALKSCGYAVNVLNFRHPDRGDKWNPLSVIEKFYRSGDAGKTSKALLMLKAFSQSISAVVHSEKDLFWEQSAERIFEGVGQMILETCEDGALTIENIALVAREINSVMGRSSGLFGKQSSKQEFQKYIDSLPPESSIRSNLSNLTTSPEDTRNSIFSVFETMVGLYVSQPALLDLLSTSTIEVEHIGERPSALFIILPDDTDELYPLATALVKQIYSCLVDLADSQGDGILPNRVSFILDEFANFAPIPSIASMLTAARSRGIRFLLVCQSIEQLKDTKKYGENGMEILLSNCRTWIYMSCRNISFLNRLVELCGKYVSPYTGQECPLISVSDLQHFEMDREKSQVLVLNDRCRPIIGWLQDYGKYDFGPCNDDTEAELPASLGMKTRNIVTLKGICHSAERSAARQRTEIIDGEAADEGSAAIRSSIDSLVAAVDAKIQQLDADEESPIASPVAADDDKEPKESDFMRCYYKGDYEKAISCCINALGSAALEELRIECLSNIAFLLRFGKVDSKKIESPISLDPKELLSPGVMAGHGFPLINQALYDIQLSEFQQAVTHLRQIPEADWRDIARFWLFDVWQRKDHNPEGALVPVLGTIISTEYARFTVNLMVGLTDLANISELRDVAEKAYPAFFAYLKHVGVTDEGSGDDGEEAGEVDELLADFTEDGNAHCDERSNSGKESYEEARISILAEIDAKIAAMEGVGFDE